MRKRKTNTAVQTCANTTLRVWTNRLNAELANRGLALASAEHAQGYYETGNSPWNAANEIEFTRG